MADEKAQEDGTPAPSQRRASMFTASVSAVATSDLISSVGDALFNVTAMWVVYSVSGSILAVAIVQVLWQLPAVLFGAIAGVWADRISPKRILVASNFLAAILLGALGAFAAASGHISTPAVLVVVFVLNLLVTAMSPARYSIMPRLVSADHLPTVNGLLASIRTGATLVGSALAGLLLATVGRAWGIIGDAISFLISTVIMQRISIPSRNGTHPGPEEVRPGMRTAIVEAWRWVSSVPVVRAFVFVLVLANAASFVGPLYPALVQTRLHAGPGAYGLIEACGVAGAMLGGIVAGRLDRALGAGHILVGGLCLAGLATLGIAASVSVALTSILELCVGATTTVAAIGVGALTQVIVPEHMRGRLGGILKSTGAVAIPITAVLGGWAADKTGPATICAVGGIYLLLVGALACSSKPLRTSRASTPPDPSAQRPS